MAAYTTIDNPELYFQTKLYTGQASSQGDGTTTAITFDGDEDMQPDLIWIKNRDGTDWHDLTDATRGVTKSIYPNEYDPEDTVATAVTAFGSDGFTVGSNDQVNDASDKYVAWCWKANGAGSANTDGSVNSTKTSANTTSGCSIVDFDLNGESGKETVGHGLGVAPDFIFAKTKYNDTGNGIWWVYHKNLTSPDYYLDLAANSAQASDTQAWDDAPTSSVFTVGSASGWGTFKAVAYCFAEKQGFSKFGSYTGNGNADGTFAYCGFRPSFVMVKKTSEAREWMIWDNKRDTYNPAKTVLHPDGTPADDASTSYEMIDMLSNGFKLRQSDTDTNQSGGTYIFMAFAEQPFVNSKGVPANAR